MLDLAIIFLRSPKTRTKLRHAVRQAGVERAVAPSDSQECKVLLDAHAHALLLTDWHPPESVQILEAAQAEQAPFTRPILLLTSEITHEISAICLEMNVTRLYTEPLSLETLDDHLQAIIKQKKQEGDHGIQEKLRESSLLQQMGQNREAIFRLNNLQEQHQPHPAIFSGLINAQIHANLWVDAEQTAQSFHETFPDDPRASYLLGRCLIHNGKSTEGLKNLQKADLLNPWNSKRLYEIGQALLRQGEFNEAHGAYKRGLAIDNGNKILVDAAEEARKLAEEFNNTLGVLKRIPTGREKASIFNHSAIVCIGHGQYERGYTLYQASLHCLKEDNIPRSRVLCNLGIGYVKGGELDKAYSAFTESVKADHDFKTAKHNLQIVTKLLNQNKSDSLEDIEAFEKNLDNLESVEFDDEGIL